jgi:large subunit ribosomal protein L23
MHPTTIIRKPLLTEKATMDAEMNNRYTFEVDRRASKDQIRMAVEALYSVRVQSVATQTRRGSTRRMRYGWVAAGVIKRALVKLHPEDRIELV